MPTFVKTRIRRRLRRPATPAFARSAVAAIALLLGLVSALGVAAAQFQQEQGEDVPSAATGHAEVIAQGVAPLPADQIAWRVTRAAAPRPMDLPENRALGFVLADEDALQVVDQETGAQVRLAAGEAVFVPEDAGQLQFALGDGPAAYYRIDLVPAGEAEDDLGDEPIFAGETFAAPEGNRDLDLVRDVLAEDEEVELDLGGADAPALLLVTAGSIELVPAGDPDAAPNRLEAGQAAGVAGGAIVRATGDDGAAFVAAVVGPEVPPVPTQPTQPTAPATPDDETASIDVTTYTCPAGYEGKDKYEDCVEPGAGIAVTVAIFGSEWSTSAETDEAGEVAFPGLGGGGEYLIIQELPDTIQGFEVDCFAKPAPGAPEPRQVEITRIEANLIGLILEPGAEVSCAWFNIPAGAQDGGSLIVGVATCPQGYDGADYAADCAEPAAGVDFFIGTPNTGNVEATTSRADGLVTFSLASYDLDPTAPDTVSVGEPAAQALDYAVFCTKNEGEPLNFAYEMLEFQPGGPLLGITFDFETGDQVACEWYNIPQPMNPGDAGTIALTVQLCPTADTPTEQCAHYAEPGVVATFTGPVFLSTDAGSEVPVAIHGPNWVWGEEGGIPLGVYYLDPSGIGVPAGYQLERVEGSLGGSEIGWAVEVGEANPNAYVNVVYVEQAGGGEEDADGDGATADQEAHYGTDPTNPDTDADGASDGQEINYGEPGPSPIVADSDGDGLLDGVEMNETGTNPTGGDSDGDLIADGDEVNAGTDPLDPNDPPGGDGQAIVPVV